ncbi:MAG: GNAT family N-acetyltransferase [Candidatus Binataceae bacterium]
MGEVTLRAPQSDDWAAILELAELSLSEMHIVPSQQEWLNNRKSFSAADGLQQHFVATLGGRIAGYAGVEHRNGWADGVYRLFVVVAPPQRATLGTRLLARLRECLLTLGARSAWFQELEDDAHFNSYLEEMGFLKGRAFKLDDGISLVRLTIDAPFQSLVRV